MDDIIDRVGHVGPIQELAPGVRNRFVVAPGEFRSQSPFVLLVEDFIQAGTDFLPHPHKGLETITFVLSGALKHGDNVGNRGVVGPDEVQWMTAGKGIVHGGQPASGEPVHALQLWVALPSLLRNSPPGTREQRRATALADTSNGSTARIYGAGSRGNDEPEWSCWPMTLIDVQLESGGHRTIPLRANERSFLYVLNGTVLLGKGNSYEAGSVIWFTPQARDTPLDLSARGSTRLVQYTSPVIDEPIVARGPFVMGSEAEIRSAFHEFQTTGFGGTSHS
ncbi:pirin family protein [Novosphingobium sp. P6W]|uniref:pirin family protein n=1 Tax=Novosphingobium sp. P6W TaxID=1609758 RepID=UPI0009E5AB3A|nr:pirin family protein [Novosphingobium sp. P6W]AXB80400.1 pirin family protein [Novosphingobium sp. P6W]